MKYLILLAALLFFQTTYSQVTPDTLKTDTLKTVPDTTVAAAPPPAPPPPAKSRRDTRPWSERIDFGFGSSFWITPSVTTLEIAPVVAYRFPKRLITGVGYRYIYRHQRVINNDLNAYGPDFFARLNVTKRIYLWTEYEILNNEYFDPTHDDAGNKSTTTTESWFAGIGYVRSLGKKGRGGVSVQVLYNFLYSDDDNDHNPYYSPVTYRVGYFF